MAYFIQEMTVQDMEAALKKTKTVIIPIGIVEQHGFHLPLSTDYHNATELPLRAGDRLNAVVAPTIPYCYSGGELPGTVNVSPQAFSLYLTDICAEFVRMGFMNIAVLLGHGGTDNNNAVELSLKMLQKRYPQMRDRVFAMISIGRLSPTWTAIFDQGPEHDFHAGQVETSLMMYWKPELVKDKIVMDEPEIARMMRTDQDWFDKSEKIVDSEFVVPCTSQRAEIKVGVMGFPETASKELGEKICNEAVDGLIAFIDRLEASLAERKR